MRYIILLPLALCACDKDPTPATAAIPEQPQTAEPGHSPGMSNGAAARPSDKTTEPEPEPEPDMDAELHIAPDFLADLESVPDDATITLGRTSCFGSCPVYTVTIDGSGKAVFEGKRWVAADESVSQQIPRAKVLELLHQAGRLGFFNIDRPTLDATCGEVVSDAPSAEITITAADRTHTVVDYHGCFGKRLRPDLRKLADAIDDAAVKESWLKPAPRRPDGRQKIPVIE